MFEIYIVLILFIIFIFVFPSFLPSNEENIEKKINDKSAIIIIPLNSLGEYSVIDDYLDDLELPPFYSTEQINRCYYLINKYNSCLKLKKNKIEKCKDIYNKKIEEELCENIKNEIFGVNNSLVDFGDIFKEENDINFFNDTKSEGSFSKVNTSNNKSENKSLVIEDKSNNNNKDCVEYGLSEDNEDLIVCTKYE